MTPKPETHSSTNSVCSDLPDSLDEGRSPSDSGNSRISSSDSVQWTCTYVGVQEQQHEDGFRINSLRTDEKATSVSDEPALSKVIRAYHAYT